MCSLFMYHKADVQMKRKSLFGKICKRKWKKVEENEKCVMGGDLNGHIGRGNDVIGRIHGRNSVGELNEE